MLAAGLALSACGDGGGEPPADSPPELVVHGNFGSGPGSVNSYWLEGADEILVFDTQLRLDLAQAAVEEIVATGKPVTAIVISHYHPDHFGGLQVFLDAFPDAELLMPEAVARQIERDLSGYIERLREINGDDYEMPPEPTRFIEDGEELSVSGVPVVVEIVPRAESSPIAMLAVPGQRALLAADLVANRMHANLVDADLDAWPRALQAMARDYTGYTVYPGHGEPGPIAALVANQSAYLDFVRNLVEHDILGDDVASEAEIAGAIERIGANYAGWDSTTGHPGQLRRNLEALVADLGGHVAGQQAEGEPETEAAATD